MAAPNDPLPLPPTPSADLPHIYVINSNEDFLETIREVLAELAVRVTVEHQRPNVQVTLGNLRSAQADLLLLDITPEPVSASHLLDALARSEDLVGLPVVLASTNPRIAQNMADRYDSLVRDILPKPFELDDLFALLHRHVGVAVP